MITDEDAASSCLRAFDQLVNSPICLFVTDQQVKRAVGAVVGVRSMDRDHDANDVDPLAALSQWLEIRGISLASFQPTSAFFTASVLYQCTFNL